MPIKKSNKSKINLVSVGFVILALVGLYLLLPKFSNFHLTFNIIMHSSWPWLLLGILVTGLSYWAAALTQYIAGNYIGNYFHIIWLQLAGSFVNTFLPLNFGGLGITEEYYHKLKQDRPTAIVIVTIPIVFGFISTVILIAIVSPITFVQLFHSWQSSLRTRIITIIIGSLVLLVILAYPFYKKRLNKLISQAKLGLKSIKSIRQQLLLIGSSSLLTILSTIALYVSVRAVHANIALVAVLILYITASIISNFFPTPGGLGATEAFLIFGLKGAGLNTSHAVAATLLFRFITFWLPLLPGIVALRHINKKEVKISNVMKSNKDFAKPPA